MEFLLVGGATLVLFPLSWLLRGVFGLDSIELTAGFLTFHAAFVVNDPHFSVTYLLFYKDVKRRAFGREVPLAQRLRYLAAGFVLPCTLVIWAAFAITTESGRALGAMIQTMFLLVGWHYVKQGFGVLAVLSARRGSPLDARERRAFLLHAFAGWAYAWANPATPGGEYEEKGVVYWAVTRPLWFERLALAALVVSLIYLGFTLLFAHVRERRRLPFAAIAGFLVSVWLWTIYSALDPVMIYLIPALHSLQYLYFVWLLRRNQARASEGPPRFGRPARLQLALLASSALALGWLLFHGVPSVLDELWLRAARATHAAPHASASLAAFAQASGASPASTSLGSTPFFAAFFAFVNLHHYFMDHVIWRRENPDTVHLRA